MFYKFLGVQLYKISLPLLRVYLKRSERVYVLLIHKGQVLFIKNWLSRQSWQLPGGGKNAKEDIKDTAIRELQEEVRLNVSPGDLKFLCSGKWKTGNLSYSYCIYTAKTAQKYKPELRRLEIVDAQWLSPADINNSNTSVEILSALRLSGLKTD